MSVAFACPAPAADSMATTSTNVLAFAREDTLNRTGVRIADIAVAAESNTSPPAHTPP
jgi:hypothetical protein